MPILRMFFEVPFHNVGYLPDCDVIGRTNNFHSTRYIECSDDICGASSIFVTATAGFIQFITTDKSISKSECGGKHD